MKSLIIEKLMSYKNEGITDYIELTNRFIQDYPKVNVKVSFIEDTKEYLAIFSYGVEANFSDPVVQESRGIIINLSTMKVVCWPFRKFGKYDDYYADKIDWSTARVMDKIDGSIMKAWYYNNRWNVSTNKIIFAKDATIISKENNQEMNFLDIFMSADNYNDIDWDSLDKDCTYIFEMVSPHTRVIIHYDTTHLFHIGTRNNITGEESDPCKDSYIGIDTPGCILSAHSLNDVLQITNSDVNIISQCDEEGYVVVDANWNRVKIKYPIYMIIHGIVNNGNTSKKLILEYLKKDIINLPLLSLNFPEIAHYLKYYDFKWTEFVIRCRAYVNICRKIYNLTGQNMKETALRIKDNKFSMFGFIAIKNMDLSFEEILDKMRPNVFDNLIPTYEPENFSYMFAGLYENQ